MVKLDDRAEAEIKIAVTKYHRCHFYNSVLDGLHLGQCSAMTLPLNGLLNINELCVNVTPDSNRDKRWYRTWRQHF